MVNTYMNIYCDSRHSGSQHLQRQELAQHTVVRPRRRRRHVTMTTMVYAVVALCRYRLALLMYVNRR